MQATNGTCIPPGVTTLNVGVGVPSPPVISYYNPNPCKNTSVTYYADLIPGATYTWSFTGDGTLTSSGNSATVTFGNGSAMCTLGVSASSSCGSSSPVTVQLNPITPAGPPTLTGPEITCINIPTIILASDPLINTNWEVTPNQNYSISLGNRFTFSQPGTYQIRARKLSGSCYGEYSAPKTVVVNAPTAQPVVSGSVGFCVNANTNLSISNPAGGITYSWSTIAGAISLNGTTGPTVVTGNSVTVTSTLTGNYSVGVVASQPAGCNSPAPTLVNIYAQAPLTTSNVSPIIGSSLVCPGYYPYRIDTQESPPVNPALNVNWTVTPTTSVSISNTSSRSAYIGWASPGTYTLTASTSNQCGAGPTHNLTIEVKSGTPQTALPITGGNTVCLNNTYGYATALVPGVTYQWIATGEILSATSNSTQVKWDKISSPLTPQSISVVTNNGNCDSPPMTLHVTVVAPMAQTITFTLPSTSTYGNSLVLNSGTASGLPATYSSSDLTKAVVTGNTVQFVGTGSVNITASVVGDGCWSPGSVTQSIIVTKATLMATADDKTRAYGDVHPPFTITYSGFVNSDNASALDTPPTVSTIATQFSNVGSYLVTPSGGADNNYTFTYVSGPFTINKAPLSITSTVSKNYGDLNPPLTLSYTGLKGTETSSVLDGIPTPSTTVVLFSNAGTYPITLSGGSDNNYAITPVTGVFTVSKAPLTITADAKSKIYGDVNPVLTVTYSGLKGTETSAVVDTPPALSTTATQFSNSGTYPITPSGGTDNNYTFTYANGVLTVNKASLTATAENKTKIFGQNNPAFTILYAGFKGTETSAVLDTPPTVSTTAVQCSAVGSIPLTPSSGADNNYSFSYITGSLSIQKTIVTFTAENKTRIYGSANPAFTFTVSGVACGDNVNVVPTGISTAVCSATGTYPITLSGASDPSYDFVYTSGALTVTKATLTATAANQSRIYGGPNSLQYSYSGFLCSDNVSMIDSQPTISTTGSSCSPPGTYPITLAGGTDNNYSIAFVSGTLQINKALITASAPALSMVYGNTLPSVTLNYSGFVCSDNSSGIDSPPSSSIDASGCSHTGTYAITLTGGGDDRYTFTRQSGTLTITQRPLTMTADNQSKVYSDYNPFLTYSYSGFSCGDGPGVLNTPAFPTTTAGSCSPAGTYPIYFNEGSDNNYSFTYINGALSVEKSMLIARAENHSRAYGSADPAFTVSYEGFHCGENPAQLDSPPASYSSATQWSNTGGYPIMLGGGSDNNYTFNLIGGTLTIYKAEQEIDFPYIPIQCGGNTITLGATASSGLPITYTSSNPYYIAISGSDATLTGEGSATIMAYQNGDGNYNPAPSQVSQALFVAANWGEITPRHGSLNLCDSGPMLLEAGGGSNHYWNTGSYSQYLSVTEIGTYTVSYTTQYGCNVSASVEVYRDSDNGPCMDYRTKNNNEDSVQPEEPGVSELSAFPNPASDRLTIAMPLKMKTETPVILYDRFGKQMLMGEIKVGESQTELAVNELINGVYIVRVGKGALLNTRKVTILHHGN